MAKPKAELEIKVQKPSKTKTALRRSRKNDCDIRRQSKSEALDEDASDGTCEIEVKYFCDLRDSKQQPEQEATTKSECRVARLESLISRLERKLQELIVQNAKVVKSYADLVRSKRESSG
ncbi:hypothetical protein LSH36_461g01000 [Paralvinella palmiformis]|uniref:Uncharacterized protein n=1 Tax=Paralvinella palmiformis TaxID=53620 RepID=A0AAD9MXA6_9ANNE|nr:hypothetical protein LSH36_461g01000 [Paralvinella palmiformis]